jgi:uncharacterized repeat protein (TIGR01451 family)/LPXTG-motif cell wall-anchored protein
MSVVSGARPRQGSIVRTVVAAGTAGALMLAGLVAGAGAAQAASGSVTGAVYQDFNDNGARDAAAGDFGGDTGVAGVTVTATDSAGAVVGTATTAADGSYSIAASGTATDAVRVGFTIPSGFRSARIGAGNDTSVQFVDLGATGVDLGVTQEGMVRTDSDTPLVVVPSQRSRISMHPSGNSTIPTQNYDTLPALFGFPYDTSGDTPPGKTVLAVQSQIGTVWGTANYRTSHVFSAASFRRAAQVGPGGLGAIYLTDARSGTPNATPFVQIPNAGADPRGVIDPLTYDWFHDSAAFDKVATVGLGDIEISSDGKTLYVVNLNDRRLYAVPVNAGAGPNAAPTAGTPVPITIPLTAATGCDPAQVRPYGLGTFRGQLYVTLTCTGPTVADLRAFVIPMDEATRQFGAPVLDIPLDYPRAAAFAGETLGGSNPYSPWRNTFSADGRNVDGATPVASSVTFDSAGDLLLSIKDRSGDQTARGLGSTNPADPQIYLYVGAGDLLRACLDASAAYVLENDGSCGGASSTQPTNDWGPGGGKFYATTYTGHGNTALGSALQIPGYTNLMGTVFDPQGIESDGVRAFAHSDGSTLRAARLSSLYSEFTGGTFAKAGGLGDLSALAAEAPVEIGDRVWMDADADGVQDAGEAPIAGVTVRLFDAAGALVASAVTDAQGDYVFSSSPGASTGSAILGLPLAPETEYEIRLDNAADYADGGPLDDVVPTRTAAGPDTAVDSNGVRRSPVLVTAAATTPSAGAADHTFDFGFSPSLSLGNRLWFDTGAGADTNNGRVDPGERPIAGAVVELLDGAGAPVLDADGDPVTATTDANGFYRFDGLALGSYRVRVAAANFAGGAVLDGWASSTGASSSFDGASNNADKGADSADPAVTGITSATVALAPGVTGDGDAGATGAGAHGAEGDAFDNLTVDFGFVQPYDLTLDKQLTSGAGPYRLGDEVTFSLTPRNNGPAVAVAGLTVSDRLPAGVEFVSATGDDWSDATVAGREITLTWEGDDLAAGDAAEPITVTARVTATGATSLRNVAVVEPSPTQRTAEAIPVGSTPDRYENGSPTPDAANPSNNDDSALIPVAAPTLSLGNRLWIDTGAGDDFDNGVFDAGERPVAGAVVELLDAAGAPVLDADGDRVTATTDASGFYRFDLLVPGQYIVQVAAATFDQGAPLDDHLSSTGASASFDAASNSTDKGVDARFPAVTGIRSGVIDLQPGVTGDVDAGATGAGANGPFGDAFDTLTADFGFVPSLSLGNRLWFDSGAGAGEADNGRFDAGEEPVAGALVELLDAAGGPVLGADGRPVTTRTDGAGFYRFDGLSAGDYRVRVAAANFADDAPLDGWFSSSPTSADAAVNNSDKGENAPAPAATGIVSGVVSLTAANPAGDLDADATGAGAHGPNGDAADLLTVDFGFTRAYAIGDRVWFDEDGDGRQDDDEPAVAGVVVTLLDEQGNSVVDLNGVPVAPVRTDANGHYVFDGLRPGVYTVSFTEVPDGYRFTAQRVGEPTGDSNPQRDGVTPPFAVGPAGSNTTAVQGADGVTVAQQIDRTIDAGLVPVLAVADFVWIDADRDGRQEAGDQPVAGVKVVLLDADGNPAVDADGTPVEPVSTDSNGRYAFDNLLPGDYRIRFSEWPAGYTPTIQSAPGSTRADDSNPDASGLTPVFTLAIGGAGMRPVTPADGALRAIQVDPTVDLGLAPQLYAVGDRIWFDTDRDGVQDDGEKPVVGMTATLRNADGTAARDWQGSPIPATKTDANGHYVFDGLPAGDYFVEFSGVPAGFTFTTQGTGGGSDSNANRAGRTPVFTLGVGASDLRTVVSADGTVLATFINPTIDAGLVEIAPPLPATGGTLPWLLIILSLLLVGSGATVLVLRRRRS